MTQQEVKHALTNIRKRARVASRTCSFEKCDQSSIQSHLLQKNGILNQISNKANQVIELAIDVHKPGTFVFKPISIGQAFTFPGFCNSHDTSVFKEIEQEEVEYTAYRAQLLFFYRALVNEKVKKMINVDVYDRILNSFKLKLFLRTSYLNELTESKRQESLAIDEFNYYEKLFLTHIQDSKLQDFEFITFALPRVDVCGSGVFTYETTQEISQLLISGKQNEKDPFTQIYFNLWAA